MRKHLKHLLQFLTQSVSHTFCVPPHQPITISLVFHSISQSKWIKTVHLHCLIISWYTLLFYHSFAIVGLFPALLYWCWWSDWSALITDRAVPSSPPLSVIISQHWLQSIYIWYLIFIPWMILFIFTIKTTFVLHNQLERSLDSTLDDRPNIIELEYINLHDNIKTFVEHFSFRGGISIDEETNLRVNWLYGIGYR